MLAKDNNRKNTIGIIAAITWCSVIADANIPNDINAIDNNMKLPALLLMVLLYLHVRILIVFHSMQTLINM